jgi:HK97 family phage major capsid protein
LKANKASKSEVLTLIDERTKDDKDRITKTQTDVTTLNSSLAETKEAMATIQKQLRRINQVEHTELSIAKGNYTGRFSSPREAKTFALLVMAGVLANESTMWDRFDHIRKSLDDLGIEPYWVGVDGKKTMTGTAQTGGGALVTVEQSATIIKLLEEYGKFRANAQPMPMSAGSTTVPKVDALLTVYCPGEGGAVTAGDPVIQTVAMIPKTLCALTAFSLELEDDSLVALGELLADLFARSFAYYEDLCGFLGDGTSTYFHFTGITGALRAVSATIANIKSLVVGAGDAYSELTLANFISVVGNLPNIAANEDAKWYVHRYFYHTVMVSLALAATGTPASEVIIGAGQKQKLFLGHQVEFTQVMPRVAAVSQICALLANLRQGAILGTRGGIEFATSDQRYFDQGLIAVRGRDRVAINAHGVGDTTKAGPICGLITAAS